MGLTKPLTDYTAGDFIDIPSREGTARFEVVGRTGDNLRLRARSGSERDVPMRAIETAVGAEMTRRETTPPKVSNQRGPQPLGAVRGVVKSDTNVTGFALDAPIRRDPPAALQEQAPHRFGLTEPAMPNGVKPAPGYEHGPGGRPRPRVDAPVATAAPGPLQAPGATSILPVASPETTAAVPPPMGAIREPAPAPSAAPVPGWRQSAPLVAETGSPYPDVMEVDRDRRGRAIAGTERAALPGGEKPSSAQQPTMMAGVIASTVAPEADASPAAEANAVLAQGALTLGATREKDGKLAFAAPKAKQRRIEKTYMESWVENAVPKMVERLVGRGMFAEATALQDFADQQQFRNGVERYASAALMAAQGNMDGFADQMTILFNDERYNPDGFTVDREASRWLYDETGEIAGAELTFRAEDGQTVTQRWDDWSSMVEDMLTAVSPEAAMQRHLDGLTAARSAQSEAATRQAKLADDITIKVVEAGLKSKDTAAADVDAALKAQGEDFNFATLPPEEQKAAVMEYLSVRDAAIEARRGGPGAMPVEDVPVLRY